jgi:AraC family transcriptional regulator of adaptative response/methylated-DNA-[protein]-cysteine methyltransferase
MESMSSHPQVASANLREDEAGTFLAGNASTMNPIAKPSAISMSTLDPDVAWRQLVARDRNARFVYGVTTTGVFCRPGCASRRPLRANVRFFKTAVEAQAAGFRPCKRCTIAWGTIAWGRPLDKIRGHIEKNLDRPVRLKELGRVTGLSPFTVQRLFKREMGVSPLQYQRAMRAGRLRGALKREPRLRRKSIGHDACAICQGR